jgi:hypothetical protein
MISYGEYAALARFCQSSGRPIGPVDNAQQWDQWRDLYWAFEAMPSAARRRLI